MTVSLAVGDATWLTTVPLAGIPTRSLGQPAGIFFAGASIDGDASGGRIIQALFLTPANKERHVLEWMSVGSFADNEEANVALLTMSTGPRLPSPATAFNNLTFRETMIPRILVGSGTTGGIWTLGTPGGAPMISFGDKVIAGNFEVLQVQIETNTNGTRWFNFGWGFYYEYQTFFRGLAAG